MELRYQYAIIVILIIIILWLFIFKNKKSIFKNGLKIANTQYLKNTEYYQKQIKKYQMLRKTIIFFFIIAIICSTVLISRLTKVETKNINKYNRDIYLCMDVSRSVDDLNMELIESLKTTVSNLKEERFGISIFNSSSVIVVPLTDDYDYIISMLNDLKKAIQIFNPQKYGTYSGDDRLYLRGLVMSGTLEGNNNGSSLIGDGLASCAYSFSNSSEGRTKIKIFSTDNQLEGTPLVSIDKAAKICKSKDIKVFGIGTEKITNKNKNELKNAIEYTGGNFYEHSLKTANEIVKDIESTSKSLLKDQIKTTKVDIPQVPFIVLLLSIVGIITIGKKV